MATSVNVAVEPVTIPVPDAGFDDHVLNNPGDYVYIGDGSYTGAWKSLFVEDGAWLDYSYYAADGDLPTLSGNNKVYGTYTADDYIYQILDETFIEGKTYTLNVWVGEAWAGYDDSWSLYFTGDDYSDELASIAGNGPVGEWGQASLVYTTTAADAGKKIGIKMKGAEYVTFEDVTLSYVDDAEPAPPSNYVTSTDQGGLVPIINRDFSEPNDGKHTAFDIEISRKQDEPFFGVMTTDVPGWTTDVSAKDSGIEVGADPNYGYSAFLMGGYSEWDDDPNWVEPSIWQILPYKIQEGDQFRLAVDARHIWTVEGVPVELKMMLFYSDINGTRQELASQIVDLTEAWEWSTCVLDVPELLEMAVGKLLGIELQNIAERSSWIHVDNISLIGE